MPGAYLGVLLPEDRSDAQVEERTESGGNVNVTNLPTDYFRLETKEEAGDKDKDDPRERVSRRTVSPRF